MTPQAKHAHKMRAEHRCVICGKQDENTLAGHWQCEECAAKKREYMRTHQAKRKNAPLSDASVLKAKKSAKVTVIPIQKTCRNCVYHGSISHYWGTCDYMLKTNHRRPCKAADGCEVWEGL